MPLSLIIFLERIWVFFWIGWGFALSGFFCTIFLVGGRSFPFWLLFIRYWVSLVSYIYLGVFYERCFFTLLFMGGSFFSFFFLLLFYVLPFTPPHDQEVGEGRIGG